MTTCKMYKTFLQTPTIYNKRRTMPCLWVGKHNIVKILPLFKLIYKFSTIPIRISERYLWNLKNQFQNVYGYAESQNTQGIFEEQDGGLTYSTKCQSVS